MHSNFNPCTNIKGLSYAINHSLKDDKLSVMTLSFVGSVSSFLCLNVPAILPSRHPGWGPTIAFVVN